MLSGPFGPAGPEARPNGARCLLVGLEAGGLSYLESRAYRPEAWADIPQPTKAAPPAFLENFVTDVASPGSKSVEIQSVYHVIAGGIVIW